MPRNATIALGGASLCMTLTSQSADISRPNSAAVRRRSKSHSLPMPDLDDESEQSSSLTQFESSQDENDDEEADEIASDSPVHQVTLPQRKPDPRASRRSSRAEAKKPVNYSKKYHPQDYGLPGHRRSAITPAPAVWGDSPKTSNQIRKRKTTIVIADSDEDDSDAIESIPARLSDDDDELGRATSRPPLRKLDSNSRPTKRTRRTDGRASKSPQVIISNTRINSSPDIDMDDMFELVDTTLTAADDSPLSSLTSKEPSPSSVTLGGTPPNDATQAACVLNIVRPYIDLPSQAKETGERREDSLTKSCAESRTASDEVDTRLVSEPHVVEAVSQAASEQHEAEHYSLTTSEQRDVEASTVPRKVTIFLPVPSQPRIVEANSQTMSAPCTVEAESRTTGEPRDPDANQQSSHFEEAMAVTDHGDAGESNADQVDAEAGEQSSQPEDMLAVAKPVGEDTPVRSESLDPLDLIPKSSYFPTTTSFPSTAVPSSDCAESDRAEDGRGESDAVENDRAESDAVDAVTSSVSLEF